ncbi:MAG: gamma-glutamyl-gamma-aminobutyrate hydrolase family protein [Actinomycetota bacterium]|nr:gamma-glutamyl-gamma-aminobutyrate hydrolase family protein [Actinomycetota bacterium]
MRMLVVGDRGDDDPGYVGERLVLRGARAVALDRDDLPTLEEIGPADLVYLLGSGRSVANPAESDRVAAETALINAALDAAVPVLGICYGAQILAHALGGTVQRAAPAELGWLSHESYDQALCPPGPWLQFHGDSFTLPQGARLLGRSESGPQGFSHESVTALGDPVRALGWQFHPEVTPSSLAHWLRVETTFVNGLGDPAQINAEAQRLDPQVRQVAYDLTDTALDWLLGGDVAPASDPVPSRANGRV